MPATLLANLGRRAAAARAGKLADPLAVEAVERLDYDFGTPRGVSLHALRVLTFDRAVRRFLRRYPAGNVVALGEGLETQFWRVDNARLSWLTVDLPEVLELRRRVLPEEPRRRSHAGSALGLAWVGDLESGAPVFVTAQGLLPYFGRDEVHALIAALAERLPGASLVFDVVPARMLEVAQRSPGRESEQAAELWSWVFDLEERAAIAAIPGVAQIRDLRPPLVLGSVPLLLCAVRCLPRRIRYALPVLPVIQVWFSGRATASRSGASRSPR